MDSSKTFVSKRSAAVLLTLALSLSWILAASADDSVQQPTEDAAPSVETLKQPALLNGSIKKYGISDEPKRQDNPTKQSDASLTEPGDPQSEKASADQSAGVLRRLFGSRKALSSEDFRNLQIGITGFVSVKSIFQKGSTVTEVFPGCPAALAGMLPGDKVIKSNDLEFKRTDAQREHWNKTEGPAGTPVDITVLRHGEKLTFHLIRMNIEDVPDPRLRRIYRRLAWTYGCPHP